MSNIVPVGDNSPALVPWTRFSDSHSGGGSKTEWEKIFIQATEDEAKVIFYNRFGFNPERVSCTCCGEDFSIWEIDEDPQSNLASNPYRNPNEKVLIIPAETITAADRVGELPEQGWVWQD